MSTTVVPLGKFWLHFPAHSPKLIVQAMPDGLEVTSPELLPVEPVRVSV